MTPERWQQVKQIFQSAIERPPDERDAFLARACQDNHALRSEVESLISSHDQAGDSIEAMAVEAATEMLANDRAIVGKQIGHYQVLSRIGRGGMGEVFLAQDTSLGRKVALKLLPADFTRNEERLRRFRQEARAASSLNHPNILTIHEIGQDDTLHFMATEYVEGETLRQHISRARMTLGQALDVAVQVASALTAAHQAGIIHRDIKPENIMLRTDGYVKVLDFGLAKLTEPKAIDTAVPTLPKVATEPGLVMGTVSYMSPEQARGLAVDARTDIWSLGVMIYEMAAGRQPFEGETASDVMSLILEKEPLPLTHSLPGVPGELERIVRKALRKDKEERYQTIKDLLIDLRTLRKELELEAEMERSLPPASISAMRSGQSAPATAHSTSSAEYNVTPPSSKSRSHGQSSRRRYYPQCDLIGWGAWSWSPDGRKLAGNKLRAGALHGILVYSLETQHYEKLTDFGGMPVWLSDSRRLLFQNQGKLYLIDSQSKKVRELLSVAPNEFGVGVTISRDDRQVYFSLVTTEADIWLMNLE